MSRNAIDSSRIRSLDQILAMPGSVALSAGIANGPFALNRVIFRSEVFHSPTIDVPFRSLTDAASCPWRDSTECKAEV